MRSPNILLFLLLGILGTVTSQSTSIRSFSTPVPLYPVSGILSQRIDDGSSPLISLQRPFVYFGHPHTQIYVNHNGHLTFDGPWSRFTPVRFPMHGNRDIIAPFWTDLDNRGNGYVLYNQYTSGSVLQQATRDINTYFPGLQFTASWVFVASWYQVAYYPTTGTQTTAQAVLISGGQYSFVLMNYGPIAATSHNVQVRAYTALNCKNSFKAGYDTENSTNHFTIPGSFSSQASGTNSVIRFSSNVNVTGRWAFRTDHGSRGCTFRGDPVQLGDSFWRDSTCAEKCTCTSQGLQCVRQPCSFAQVCRPSSFHHSCQNVPRHSCTISGDPHYRTFDGTLFHFQGTCTYILSEQCRRNLPYYRVEGKNEHRGSTRVSWTRLVKVYVHNETIELVKGRRGEAKVNGNFAATPISLNNGSIQIYESGFSVTISTNFGLVVSYDTNHYVRISLPSTYQNATCGLCGNFNSRGADDFQTPQGEVVSSDVTFANSWKVSGDDDPGCEARCSGLACAGCTDNEAALFGDTGHCGILESPSGPFAACRMRVNPQPFVESCVYDLCVAGGHQPVLCQALNVYATQCQENGVQLPNWRSPGLCEIQCPANSHFESQGSGCPATCVNLNSTQTCPLPAQESCVCNAGYVLSGGVCVPLSECGCSFEGRYYRSGATVIPDEDCGRRCSCSHGSMTCRSHSCGPLESCRVEDGERGCRPNSYGTCWLKGSGSYHMFDGLTYHYPGACRLTLARVMGFSDHPHFLVTAEKVPRGQHDFARLLKFEALGTQVTIDMADNSVVQVDGQLIRLPFRSASNQIQVYHSSIHSIILQTAFGVSVQTVSPDFVRITAPGIYNGSLGGLCGNFNGDSNDDFRTPNGMLVNSSLAFGDSWREGPINAQCVNPSPTSNYNSSRCDIIASPDSPFTQCWAVVDPQRHVNICREAIRFSGHSASALCEQLQGYALMCQQKGVTLEHWRNVTGCEQTCPLNSHYELCGSTCPFACPSLSAPFSCGTLCQEGCQCDDGFVLSGNQCVLPTSCGCYHEGHYRQAGEQFWDGDECQSFCSCNGTTGAVHCAPSSCGPQESCRVVRGEFGCHPNPHGTCSASGDPHYLTFDQKAYDFQGTCRYVLATLCNDTSGLPNFSVEAKNEPWFGLPVSVTAEVFVNVSDYQFRMTRGRRGMVEINGITANVPVVLSRNVSIFASGHQTFIEADFGLRVMYDGSSVVSISVPSHYRGLTCGLCGNFNGNQSDDFTTPSGAIVTAADEFGAAWKVANDDTCSDGCGSSCPRCTNEQPARAQCEVIKAVTGPFRLCHQHVDPTPYFNDCVFDTCLLGNERQEPLCRTIEAYISACHSANVEIFPWRDNTTCRLDCPANSHYELCGTDCGHTCASSIDATCERVCSEGCFCDEGFLRSGTTCVPVESCGCTYEGFYYNVGESFWKDGCSEECTCHSPNDLRCSSASCTPTRQCRIRNGQLGCFDSMSTCTVWGDPHYISFDGALAHFQGTCSYIITESMNHSINETQFRVVATNNHRGNNRVSFVSAVDVYLSKQTESMHIRLGPNRRVMVNGSEVTLPVTGNLAQLVKQGSHFVVDATHLIVQFDGRSTLLVRISQHCQNRVTGMCGNFNNDPADDKVLPNGTLAQNDNEFGHGWKSPTSQPGCGSTDEENDDGLNDCTFKEEYSELCSVITNTSGPFSTCHRYVDPEPFFSSCVFDLCLYTPANGMLCSAIAAYERTCSVLGLNITEWRSALHCAESDPCEELNCTENEWCGEKDGVYDCFCDERHHRPNNESYDSSITCAGSSGSMSVSRCQLFEAGFHSNALHLKDNSCQGTLQDGRLMFHFNNDDQLCGTVLRSNGTHFVYENVIQGDVDPHDGPISRQRNIHLRFCCEYPLSQALSMSVGINPVESIVSKKLPAGQGQYQMRMIPYQDAGFHFPLTSNTNIEIEIDEKLYVEVRTEGVDGRQIATILQSCWATPVNNANYPVRWDLISSECPNPADDTVEMVQNGVSTRARFSFRMFTFTNYSSIYLHCQVQLCLLRHNNCTAHCYPGHHRRVEREVSHHDSSSISLGPLHLISEHSREKAQSSSTVGKATPVVALLVTIRSFPTPVPLYPVSGILSQRIDDGSSPLIALQRPFVYFGHPHTQIYVNHNGHLTFDGPWSRFAPVRFPIHGNRDIIAPFWTDLDNRGNGYVLYNQYTSGSVLQQATRDINTYFPGLQFTASWVFVASWYQVAYYPTTGTQTTAQAVLISGGQYSFVLMNYGPIAATNHSVQVRAYTALKCKKSFKAGYDTENSTNHFTIPGSFSSQASGTNSVIRFSSNVNVTGRWAFRTDHGSRGCTFRGDPVQLGDSFWRDSTCAEKCTCTSQGLQCVRQPCSFAQVCRPSSFHHSCQNVPRHSCTISGDPHYRTFDGARFSFQGTCTYILSEQCRQDLPYFRVEGKNEHIGSTRVSWTGLVKVYVHNETIELVRGRRGEAKVNGNFAATPISLNNGSIQIYESGFSVTISTNFGLVVSYHTNYYVRISLPSTYQNATCGLCGNFNSRGADDFQTPQGEVVSSDVTFANSWKVSGDDDPGCDAQCSGLACAGCTDNETALFGDTGHCGILQSPSGPFAVCHMQLNPQPFVESCVFDLCVAGGHQPVLCQALNVYATQCQENGVQLPNWRSPGLCEIQCPANSHFESQGSGCPATCVNPNSTQTCPLPAQESCVCNAGYVLSGGVCVPLSECGCSFEGRYYRSGATVIPDEDCGRRCSCSHGSMTCRSHSCGPLESCRVEDGERGCRPNSYGTCWLKGSGSYHMFDGLTYHYPGACRLTLARVMGFSDHPHFLVTAEKVPRGQHDFARLLKFEALGTQVTINMADNSVVQVDGQLIRLPFRSASNQIQVYHSSIHSIILQTAFGVSVQTVSPDFVRITAPGIYNGSLGGLCGNFNGDSNDDFRTPNGMLVNSSLAFGDSWREGPINAQCVNPSPTSNYNSSRCDIIASPDSPFTQCWAVVDPQRHVNICREAIRFSGHSASALCEQLQGYALMCQQKGVTLEHWRNVTGCEQTCPLNSHYELCGSTCPFACPSLSAPFSCGTLCQEGCQCDDGFVLSGNQCVPPTSCGCYHEGHYRQAGEQFWDGDECQSFCSCNGTTGAVHCAPSSCGPQESCRVVRGEFGCHPNPHGTCSASGDPHYLTFDQKAYDFQGTCRYVLATLCNDTSGLPNFSVEAKNEPWFGLPVSVTAEVFVNVSDYQFRMTRGRRGMVEINGITANVPVVLSRNVSIFASGHQTFIEADFGLRVMYDGSSVVSISVPSHYRGLTCGLCGNFNGNQSDDFTTPSGAIVTAADEFGAAWKVANDDTCSDGCGSSCPRCTNEQPARAQCEVIKAVTGPFRLCHQHVDPTPYFNDCVFDTCLLGNERQEPLCRTIEAYISACHSANVEIFPWRDNTTCRLDCPANSHYELCGTDCGHTCASSIDATCERVCSEGCFCDEGFLRSGTTCVPVESCGCTYKGFYYNVGESFWKDGCSEECTCHSPNDLRCSSASCTPTRQCRIRNGQLGCFDSMSTCTVWGDPHYISFDGALAHFQGTCSYIITESMNHSINETQFRVVATNNHRGNNRVSFVSAVDVYLSKQTESMHIRLGPNRRVMVNGSEVTLPVTGNLAQLVKQGSHFVVDATHLIVQFDGRSTLLVRISQHCQNRVTGMCGNFNNDPADDKVLPNGTLAQNDNEFGHGWKSPTSQPGCGATDEDISDGLNNCTFKEEYSELCSVITNTSGPFSTCHRHVDPEPFFSSCVFDLCLYTPANGMLCSAIAAYERTCSVLGLGIQEWRSALDCPVSDPCEELNCTEHEWCGKRDGTYGCFCDEEQRSRGCYDSSITCSGSSGSVSLSRCQLFEAGINSSNLHLKDNSCQGTLQDGRLVFHFNNDDQLCGTVLRSNGTHFVYENVIQGDDPISHQRNIHLRFCCEYPLSQALSMSVGINPVESMVSKKLPAGQGQYQMRMIPYQDAGFHFPLTSNTNIEIEIDEKLYVEVQTEGVDDQQFATILQSCWATPVNNANYPVRWDIISAGCPNTADDTVEMVQNGVSTRARFSFRMFAFTNYSSIYLHCRVQLCLLASNNCKPQCNSANHKRIGRDVSHHDSTSISLGPLHLNSKHKN
ncbi:uncharacterized protein LOC115060456 [Echeneis naucrates]|uniref:uncharacterized protein LOC115060456 n=1 Tax=Echeneis naucrates TaxID=173247 RepID=UPI001113FDA3|nr:uncharacterized protein LOC115060456 [Echeneis naucrates]